MTAGLIRNAVLYNNKRDFSLPELSNDQKTNRISANNIASIKIIFFFWRRTGYYSNIIAYEVYSYVSQEYS
jgi:hypothetical protein